MIGRASIFIILGFSAIFVTITTNFSKLSKEANSNLVDYYAQTQARNLSVSGANMAANELFLNPNWSTGYTNLPYFSGSINVSVTTIANGQRRLESIGIFHGVSCTTTVVLRPSSFAKFAFYVTILPGNLYFISGDTVWGPFHSQQKLNVSGSPVFHGKVTTKLGLKKNPSSSTPKFYGGYQTGIDLPLPLDVSNFKTAATTGGKYFNSVDVYMTFNADGTVTYKEGNGSPQTVALSTLAPNGTILVEKGDLHIKGTINGKYTIGAIGSSGLGHGNVYLDDDVRYRNNPLYAQCSDMLGIIAENNIIIADTPENKNSIDIHASLFSLKGGLGAENYNHIGPCGSINLVGGLIEYQDQATGTFNSQTGQITNGYQSRFRYDERFMIDAPPYYPMTGGYEVISWLE